jgi:hypothetical protein
MKRVRTSLGVPAALALAGMISAPAATRADGFRAVVRAPHATFAFHVGHPAFPVGAVVAPPFARRVFYRPAYGYGFWAPSAYCTFHGVSHAHFIPVRRYRTGWIVVGSGRVHGRAHVHG